MIIHRAVSAKLLNGDAIASLGSDVPSIEIAEGDRLYFQLEVIQPIRMIIARPHDGPSLQRATPINDTETRFRTSFRPVRNNGKLILNVPQNQFDLFFMGNTCLRHVQLHPVIAGTSISIAVAPKGVYPVKRTSRGILVPDMPRVGHVFQQDLFHRYARNDMATALSQAVNTRQFHVRVAA